jgi:hypothetical protein
VRARQVRVGRGAVAVGGRVTSSFLVAICGGITSPWSALRLPERLHLLGNRPEHFVSELGAEILVYSLDLPESSRCPGRPTTVHIGARVSALAGPNDVLVSSTLRDLVIGSGLEFDDRGAHQLKGVPGEWRLFAVASSL